MLRLGSQALQGSICRIIMDFDKHKANPLGRSQGTSLNARKISGRGGRGNYQRN